MDGWMAKGQSASVSQSGGRQNVANDAAGFWATSIAPGFLWSSGPQAISCHCRTTHDGDK